MAMDYTPKNNTILSGGAGEELFLNKFKESKEIKKDQTKYKSSGFFLFLATQLTSIHSRYLYLSIYPNRNRLYSISLRF